MKAIVRKAYGGTDQLSIEEVERPEPKQDQVLIEVKAFGINRAEIYMRKGQWGDVAPISGIECVGVVAADPQRKLKGGQRVAAIMGGMGRTINGSYAEYTCVPRNNVVTIDTSLEWPELAAIPESYATAWACLHQNLRLDGLETVVVRGGTSALGLAAINIAASSNRKVIATTRNPNNIPLLESLGAYQATLDSPSLSDAIRSEFPAGVDAVLDIVGTTTLLDSLKMVRKGGTVCNAGFLGGGDAIPFNPLTDMPPGANLNFFASFMFGSPDYPLDEIPLQKIVDNVAGNTYAAKPAHIFDFSNISKAHELMESNTALGKIVVVL